MQDLESVVRLARQEAGHCALRAVADHGIHEGEAVIRGYVEGFVTACAAVSGWTVVNQIIAELSRGVPQAHPRPRLVTFEETNVGEACG